MSKYCHKCGSKMEDDEIFCGKCGTKVVIDSPAPSTANTASSAAPAGAHNSRLLPIILAVAAVLVIVILVSGGRKLSGTYRATDWSGQTFTFSGNKVTMTAFGVSAEGTYKISGDKIDIHYNLFGSDYDMSQSFSKKGKTINIGGTEFEKQ